MLTCWKKRIRDQKGSMLIWVLVVALAVALLAATLLLGATAQNRKATQGHTSSQAYYTAFSGAKAMQEWFYDEADEPTSDAARFLKDLTTAPNKTLTFEFPEASLGAQTGSCVVTAQYTNPENTTILLSSEGRFADNTYVLEVVLNNKTLHGSASTIETQTIDLTAYNDYAAELNAFVPDPTPLIVGRQNPIGTSGGVNLTVQGNNADDAAITAAGITAASNREVLFDRPNADNDYGDEVIGTYRWPTGLYTNNAQYDGLRRFVVPPNGLMTINPLRYGGYDGMDTPTNTSSGPGNTRFTTLSIGNTAGKDIKIRLAGQNYNSIYNNSASGYNFNSSNRYYNGFMAFDFVDNAGNTENRSDLRYYENELYSDTPLNGYHPINWNSGTIYTQQTNNATYNQGLYSRLVFAGYFYKYDYYADWFGTGAYTANPWYGQNVLDYRKTSPGMTDGLSNVKGMPYLPVFYGPNFNLYLLDDDVNNAGAMLTQGVNIVDGTIYSRRGLQLGGAMVPISSSDYGARTKHDVNSKMGGYFGVISSYYGNYVIRSLRWDQQIVNTDIVLLAPAGKTRNSEIFAPEGYYDPANKTVDSGSANSRVDSMTKQFKPIESITGGTIYVGTGQTLTIHGTVVYNAGRMNIAPDKIIIETGGKVIVEASTSQNIDTQFYVNGGTLQIDDGANLKADIFVYNKGALSLGNGTLPPVKASFTLTPKTVGIGIVICSDTSMDTNGVLVGEGYITSLNNGTSIKTPTSETVPIHYLGGTSATQSAPAGIPCNPDGNHICTDFGGAVDMSAWNVESVRGGL